MKCPKSLRYAAEPVLLLYAFGLMINAPILNQFIYKRISDEKGFPYHYSGDKSGCGTEIQNETLKMLQKEVQGLASYFQIVFSLCNAVPSIIVCLFMGAWSDSVGRKPVLILSVLGSVLECTIILVIIYYDLPLWLLFIGGVLNGLGGYFTTVTMAVLAYIADTTEEKERAVRLGLMEAIVFFGGTFSNFLSGYLITEFDFRDSYWFVFAFLTSSLLYALFVLPESLPRCKRQTAKSFCLAFPKKTWQTLARPRPHKWKLKVLIPADGFVNFLNYGTSSVVTLYLLNYPFCWASIRVGYFSGIKMLITGFGAFFVLKVFKRCLADYSMLLLGFSSNIAFYSVLALSKVSWLLYFGKLLILRQTPSKRIGLK